MDEILVRIKKKVEVKKTELYSQIGIRSHGKGIFYKKSVSGKELGNKSVFWIEPDCFVVNIVFAWEMAIAKSTKADVGLIASHRFPMYKPYPELLDLDFLLYYFKMPLGKYLLGLASPGGAGRNKTLGQKEFADLEICIPSLSEQQEIVAILSTWDNALTLKTELIEEKKQQKKGLMQKLLSGEKLLDGFNTKWKEVCLGDIGESYTGLTGKTKDDFGKGFPFIPYKNIFKNSRIDIDFMDYVEISSTDNQNKVQYGDFFFTTSSETPEEVGMASVLLDNVDEMYLNSFCFGFRSYNFDVLIPEYACFFLRSKEFRKEVIRLAQGSTRFNLSKKQLLLINCILPSIEEQKAIAEILTKSDNEITLLEKELEETKEQKRGLMQKLLTGKLEVLEPDN